MDRHRIEIEFDGSIDSAEILHDAVLEMVERGTWCGTPNEVISNFTVDMTRVVDTPTP